MATGRVFRGRHLKRDGTVIVRIISPYRTRMSALRLTEQGRAHSPTGFEWGYNGSGPAALAHSILTEVLCVREADALHMRFKRDVIAHLPREQFELTEADVRAWASAHLEGDAACRMERSSCREPNLAARPSWMERATKMASHLQAAIEEHIITLMVERVTDRTLRVVGADGVRFIVTVVEEDA